MLRVFYALGDTRTPALIGVGVSAVTIVTSLAAALLTSGPDLVVALAACFCVASALGLAATARLLRRRLGRIDGHRLVGAHLRMLVAGAAAGLAGAGIVRVLSPAAGD